LTCGEVFEPATSPGTVPVTPFEFEAELLVELPRK
jgi:hypothetical protein